MSFDKISPTVYKLAIVLATVIWGFSFMLMKDALNSLAPAWLLGIRFTTAGVIAIVILWKRITREFNLRVLCCGVILGILDFGAFFCQTEGLNHTTPGINAFLTALYCVVVPFAWWVIGHRKPTSFNIVAAVVAVAGIWFVSVNTSGETLGMGLGEALTLACAVIFAIHIVFVTKFSRFADVLVLTALQFFTEGLCGLGLGAATSPAPSLDLFTPELMGTLVFLILLATILCFGIQNVALAYVPPAQAALLLSLESVFGVLFSVLFYGEQLTGRLILGFVLIFIAVLISEVLPEVRNNKRF